MSVMRKCIYVSMLGVLLALSAGCHHAEAHTSAPATSPASAVEAHLNDPKVPQAEKDQIRKHMAPAGGGQ